MIRGSSDETNSPHELSLTDRRDPKLCEAFANNSSANIKSSKTQLFEIVQSGGCFGIPKTIGPLRKAVLILMINALKPLGESILVPFSTINSSRHEKL